MLTGNLEYETSSSAAVATCLFTGSTTLSTNTATYNFGYQQGFLTGTQLGVTFNNSRGHHGQPFQSLQSRDHDHVPATATQHLLQGFGSGHQRTVYRAGKERPQDYRLGVPAAVAVHGEPGGEHLLGTGERVRG